MTDQHVIDVVAGLHVGSVVQVARGSPADLDRETATNATPTWPVVTTEVAAIDDDALTRHIATTTGALEGGQAAWRLRISCLPKTV
jgi:hypothetical protein